MRIKRSKMKELFNSLEAISSIVAETLSTDHYPIILGDLIFRDGNKASVFLKGMPRGEIEIDLEIDKVSEECDLHLRYMDSIGSSFNPDLDYSTTHIKTSTTHIKTNIHIEDIHEDREWPILEQFMNDVKSLITDT